MKRAYCKFVIAALVMLAAASCSSAPKRPAEVFAARNMASGQLELASQTANQGRFNEALLIIEDVKRTAVGIDSPQLIIRSEIVLGNVLFSIGQQDEAFKSWEAALRNAEKDGEKNLASHARIYAARGRLLLLSADSGAAGTANRELEEIVSLLNREITALKGDSFGEAAGWAALGLAEKELRHYTEAENSVRKALAIHEKKLYLEEAAYDWYLIASIRSVSQRYNEAIDALKTAIKFNRRAENGFGLATNWHGLGEVYSKSGNAAEANASYRRAADIYNALGMEEAALKAEAKIRN
ncbi:MAG: tetratricopeptide repeat protein [Treponema sp.]|jgi:tetratricopeptide (TPR) repeat protein|nr:tetratricopeptide repeat protein [Treponema sp.]